MAIEFSFNAITSDQTDVNSPITEDLMEGIRQNLIHLRQSGYGDGAGGFRTPIDGHNHPVGGSNSAPLAAGSVDQVKIAALSVGQAELITANGTVSHSTTSMANYILAGGTYGFYPRTYMNNAASGVHGAGIVGDWSTAFTSWTSIRTNISLVRGAATSTIYAWQQYIAATGKDHWIFIRYNTMTSEIISVWEAEDHPCYGQGDDESVIHHPFADFLDNPLPPNEVIFLIDNSIVNELKGKRKRSNCIAQIINEQYDIDFGFSKPIYKSREIIEIDKFGDMNGKIISNKNGVIKKRRMVTKLPVTIEYKNLKLR